MNFPIVYLKAHKLPLACWFTFLWAFVACSQADQGGAVKVGFIGQPESLVEQGVRLSTPSQHLRGATSAGLVAFDSAARIVPDLAERWHVSPDGLYYTFKLREASWLDGDAITADEIRRILSETKSQLEGTSLGLDLSKIEEIRAMTGRVIEVRLSSPMPEFLRMLAQPELGIVKNGIGSGPMTIEREDGSDTLTLHALPPEKRGLPVRSDWADDTRKLTLRVMPSKVAIAQFTDGELDLLLNGTLSDLPLAELGPLSRGTVQIDPTQGLFGLAFLVADGFFADPKRREALSMAVDREALIQPFGLAGWRSANVIVPPGLTDGSAGIASRWDTLDVEQRMSIASTRIANWKNAAGEEAVVRLRLPDGPGNDQLFDNIEEAWSSIGVTTIRVADNEAADLELRDRIARYSSARWFLNQFNCDLRSGLCSERADELVEASLQVRDSRRKEQLLADAHVALLDEEVFIPFGAPVRWSLVRGSIEAYEPNPWGVHPLFPLIQSPN